MDGRVRKPSERDTRMSRTSIPPPEAAPAVGPYAQAIRAGGFVFASGQLPIEPSTGTFPEGSEAQTRTSLANLSAVLRAGGATLGDIVKTTVFLKDMNDFAGMNAV